MLRVRRNSSNEHSYQQITQSFQDAVKIYSLLRHAIIDAGKQRSIPSRLDLEESC